MKVYRIRTFFFSPRLFVTVTSCALLCCISIGCYNGKTPNDKDRSVDGSASSAPDVLDAGIGTEKKGESGYPKIIDSETGAPLEEPQSDGGLADAADLSDANPDSREPEETCPEIDFEEVEELPNFSSGGSDIVSVVAGAETTCVVKSDGNVVCWGDVPFWMMQAIQEDAKSTPYVQTTSLGLSMCLLGADGHIDCHARFYNSLLEAAVPSDAIYTQICASVDHGCALDIDGNIDCWGMLFDYSGYKGILLRLAADAPADEYLQVSCDDSLPCALKNDGSIACWLGSQTYGALLTTAIPPPYPELNRFSDSGSGPYLTYESPNTSQAFKQFSLTFARSGSIHKFYAVTDAGRVNCWVKEYGDFGGYIPEGSFRQISLGGTIDCALRSDGETICWGTVEKIDPYSGNSYRLPCIASESPPTSSITPYPVVPTNCSMWCPHSYEEQILAVMPDGPYTQVDAGHNHVCALRSNGSIACWGNNSSLKATVPSGPYRKVCGTCAIKDDDTIACWNGDEAPSESYQQVSCTKNYGSCGITDDNRLVCWGEVYDAGMEIPDPTGSYSQVNVGRFQTCAITNEGAINCWNQASGSTVGGDEIIIEPPPESPYVQVSCGDNSSCAIKEDGGIVCWGSESMTDITENVPTGSFVQVRVGRNFACALGVDKQITCWGVYYAWTDDGTGHVWIPAVAPEGSFIQIAAGPNHACGIREDGQLICWGENVFIAHGPPAGTFAALEEHASCAIDTDGSVICWGEDNDIYLPARL